METLDICALNAGINMDIQKGWCEFVCTDPKKWNVENDNNCIADICIPRFYFYLFYFASEH